MKREERRKIKKEKKKRGKEMKSGGMNELRWEAG